MRVDPGVKQWTGFVALFVVACGGGGNSGDVRAPDAMGGMANSDASTGGTTGSTGGHTATGGKSSSTGGQASGGTASNTGRSSAGTGGGQATDGGTGLGATCKNAPPVCLKNTKLPAKAPALSLGTFTNISPAVVPFNLPNVFTQALATDGCDVSTLYLTIDGFDTVAAKAGLYKSTDAGATWRQVSQLDEPIQVVVDPAN